LLTPTCENSRIRSVPNTVPGGCSGTALEHCSGTVFQLGTVCSKIAQVTDDKRKNPDTLGTKGKIANPCSTPPVSLGTGVKVGTCSGTKAERE